MTSDLRWLLAPNPSPMTLDGTRTYIVGWAAPVVIDPGPDIRSHIDHILDLLDGTRPAAIVITHAHRDHSGAANDLAAATGAPVLMGAVAGDLSRRNHRPVGDGDVIETDAGRLHVVSTPGHTPDHIALHWTDRGDRRPAAVFLGDLMMGRGDTALVAKPEGDLRDYLASLDRIGSLAAGVLFPAHGEPLSDPAEAVQRYRRHREDRIEQVVTACRAIGAGDLDALVDRVYGDRLDPRLRGAARGSVAAILHHLATGC